MVDREMDPTETLRMALALANDEESYYDNRDTIISYFLDLDHWLANGGFLPDQWEAPTEDITPTYNEIASEFSSDLMTRETDASFAY